MITYMHENIADLCLINVCMHIHVCMCVECVCGQCVCVCLCVCGASVNILCVLSRVQSQFLYYYH